jgi:uncharacterized protein YyaL (SSP411 family)
VPHFEKTLYDNAQLAALLVLATQLAKVRPLEQQSDPARNALRQNMTHDREEPR